MPPVDPQTEWASLRWVEQRDVAASGVRRCALGQGLRAVRGTTAMPSSVW